MGLFDFLKKKTEKTFTPVSLTVENMQKGWVLEYDMKNWVVSEVYEYDWGNNNFSVEYKIDSGNETYFLSVEKDDHTILSLTRKVKIRAIDENLPDHIKQNETPPKKLVYNGVTYFMETERPGYFRNVANESNGDEWEEFIAWEYEDETGQKVLTIEQWGEHDFDAAAGVIIPEHQISNILPSEYA